MTQPWKRLNLAVALFALVAAGPPSLAQTTRLETGPASPLSAPVVYAEAPSGQWMSTLAATPEGWIALWTDDGANSPYKRLRATRLRPDGTVLDPVGILIASEIGLAYHTYAAVPDPLGARIFWAVPEPETLTLHSATLSDQGEISDDIVIGAYPGDITTLYFDAAVSGSRSAVLLDRYVMIVDGERLVRIVDIGGYGSYERIVAAGNILMRQTLDLDGNAMGPAGGIGVASVGSGTSHAVASGGNHALLVWSNEDATALRFVVIDPDSGTLTDTGHIDVEGVVPHAVWTGSSYLVSWPSSETGEILGVRISAAGAILDDVPRHFNDPPLGFYEMAARGSDLLMLYQGGYCRRGVCETDVYAAPVGDDGTAARVLISGAAKAQSAPAVASDGARFLTLWQEGIDELNATETTERSRAPSPALSLGTGPRWGSSVASNGSGYLAAWIAYRDSVPRLEGAAFTRSGESLSPRLLSFDTGDEGADGLVSTGASDDVYLVAWRVNDAIRALRVRPDGEPFDQAPIQVSIGQPPWTAPSIAFDGDDFLLAWYSYSGDTDQVLTHRVSRGGAASLDRIWASAPLGRIEGTALACSDSGICLLVWAQRTTGDESTWQLFGQRFRRGGALADAVPLLIDTDSRRPFGLSVAWNGSEFIVNWAEFRAETFSDRVEARVIPATSPLESRPPDIIREVSGSPPIGVTTCNRNGRCILVGEEPVDDAVLGRTSRLFKRFFAEPRHRGVRR